MLKTYTTTSLLLLGASAIKIKSTKPSKLVQQPAEVWEAFDEVNEAMGNLMDTVVEAADGEYDETESGSESESYDDEYDYGDEGTESDDEDYAEYDEEEDDEGTDDEHEMDVWEASMQDPETCHSFTHVLSSMLKGFAKEDGMLSYEEIVEMIEAVSEPFP